MIMASRVGAGAVRSGEGMLASPWVGERFPRARAMQASPPRSAPPPPLRDWMRLKTLHTRIHKKPTPESQSSSGAGIYAASSLASLALIDNPLLFAAIFSHRRKINEGQKV